MLCEGMKRGNLYLHPPDGGYDIEKSLMENAQAAGLPYQSATQAYTNIPVPDPNMGSRSENTASPIVYQQPNIRL
jgi:hypothetical protein